MVLPERYRDSVKRRMATGKNGTAAAFALRERRDANSVKVRPGGTVMMVKNVLMESDGVCSA
jgi:hypothetical protein